MLGTVASHLAVTAGHARKMKLIALLPELASHLLALYDTTQVADAGDSAVETFEICIVALLFCKFGRGFKIRSVGYFKNVNFHLACMTRGHNQMRRPVPSTVLCSSVAFAVKSKAVANRFKLESSLRLVFIAGLI